MLLKIWLKKFINSIDYFSWFGYQLISNTFTYEQIKISINNIHKKLMKKIEYKLLTIKNYKKWLFKNNIEYQIIDKKSNKDK